MRKKLLNAQSSQSKRASFQGTIDYKNTILLKKFITSEGKIIPRRVNGLSAKDQRRVTKSIKNARMMGFLTFIQKDS